MTKEKKSRPWIKDLLVAFAGTTLSIILTFGTSALVNNVNRNRDRKLTALMVLSSMESSVRSLEENSEIMARKDTLASWLLSIPVSEAGKLEPEVLMPSIAEVMTVYSISTDKTIETIFSSDSDTWKNIGSFQFIDNVGKAYTSLRDIEEDWRIQARNLSEEYNRILEHPDKYPGKTIPEKVLSNQAVRIQLMSIHDKREWLKYVAFALRESNRRNMNLIGISEDEVIAFTDARSREDDVSGENLANEAYMRGDFSIPGLSLDSLFTIQDNTRLVDSLLKEQK